MVPEWAQFWVRIRRTYIFICDKCRSHLVEIASPLLQTAACACLFSSSGNTGRAHTHKPLHSLSQPLLLVRLFCSVFLPSSHR